MSAEDPRLRTLHAMDVPYIIGVDEVGRGSLAGPLVVSGAVLPKWWSHKEVKDSKKFSGGKKATAHQKRLKVLREIIRPICFGEHTVSLKSDLVDTMGIDKAVKWAMEVVLLTLLPAHPDAVAVVDGEEFFNLAGIPQGRILSIPKADDLVPAVSAASILAKTSRDAVMHSVATIYPEYGFSRHVGYGTKEHHDALMKYGPCPIHRRSYKPVQYANSSRNRCEERSTG